MHDKLNEGDEVKGGGQARIGDRTSRMFYKNKKERGGSGAALASIPDEGNFAANWRR